MAKVESKVVEISPAVEAVVEKRVILDLSEEEASHLSAIVSGLGGMSDTRQALTNRANGEKSVHDALIEGLGLPYGTYYFFIDPDIDKSASVYKRKWTLENIPSRMVVEKVKYHD